MATIGRPKLSADIECVCGTCGKRWTKPEWSRSGTRYCSSECYNESRRGRPRPDWRIENRVEVACGACGKLFITGGRYNRRYGSVYCSRRCQGAGTSKQSPLREMSGEEIAWLAGLFDGEGNIAWPRKDNIHAVRVSIANTCIPLLDRCLEVTGTGAIVGSRNKNNPKHRPVWNWACYGDNARELLRVLLPWLIVKKQNALIVLEAVEEWKRTGKSSADFGERISRRFLPPA